jgi:hypothetical protein
MKVISSTFLPFKGFTAINLFGIIVVRKEYLPLTKRIINHEAIHTHQIKELLFVGFYVWYLTEWIVRLIYYRNFKKAYRAVCFEQEAFSHDIDLDYLHNRERFAFLRFIK